MSRTLAVPCKDWVLSYDIMSHAAHLVYAAAILTPKNWNNNNLIVRGLLSGSHLMMVAGEMCMGTSLWWSFLLATVNIIHLAYLLYTTYSYFLKTPKKSLVFYDVTLQIYGVSRQQFKMIMDTGRIGEMEAGCSWAEEGVDLVEFELCVLLEGEMTVWCDSLPLHKITPGQFINSAEWIDLTRRGPNNWNSTTYQVTVEADGDVTFLTMCGLKLERLYDRNPFLRVVMNTAVGKDINKKLYSMNDHSIHSKLGLAAHTPQRNKLKTHKWSYSLDALHTMGSGNVMSDTRVIDPAAITNAGISVSATNSPRHKRGFGSPVWMMAKSRKVTQQWVERDRGRLGGPVRVQDMPSLRFCSNQLEQQWIDKEVLQEMTWKKSLDHCGICRYCTTGLKNDQPSPKKKGRRRH